MEQPANKIAKISIWPRLELLMRGFVFVLVSSAFFVAGVGLIGLAIQSFLPGRSHDISASLCSLPIGLLFTWAAGAGFQCIGSALDEAGVLYDIRNRERERLSDFKRICLKLERRTAEKAGRYYTRTEQLKALGFRQSSELQGSDDEPWETVDFYIITQKPPDGSIRTRRMTVLTCTEDEWRKFIKECVALLGGDHHVARS